MSDLTIQCLECGKRYRLPSGGSSRSVRCRACQTMIPIPSNEVEEDEIVLPELPKVTRRKVTKRTENDEVDADEDGIPKKRRSKGTRSQQQGVSPFAVVAIFTLVLWIALGVFVLISSVGVWSLVWLVPHGFVLLLWGMAGVSLVAQEENESHGMICWSSFLLFLTPVIPCIALVSLIGLVLIMFYGLAKLERTGWYTLMIIVAIGELTLVGWLSTQFPMPS